MRKAIVVILVVLMILALSLGAFAFQNEPDGFRGLKWGDPVTEEMEYDGASGELAYYVLPDNKMFIGNAEFYMIFYSFYEGRFSGVELYFHGKDNYNLLAMICKYRFGEEVEQRYYELNWTGQRSSIALDYDTKRGTGDLSLTSAVIALERSEDPSKKEAEKAEGDW